MMNKKGFFKDSKKNLKDDLEKVTDKHFDEIEKTIENTEKY